MASEWYQEREREKTKQDRPHVSASLISLQSVQSNAIAPLICLQCKMPADFDVFSTSCHSTNLQNQPTAKALNYLNLSVSILPLFQIQHNASRQHNVYWFCGSQTGTLGCLANGSFYSCPAFPHSHHNLGLITPSCFCNLNIYRAPCQHAQSSTLHLHTDVEANRAERFGINTVCHQHLLTQSWN